PPELANECTERHYQARGQRQLHAQSSEQVGEDRHHELEQCADHQHGDADNGAGINHRGFNGGLQLDCLFHVGSQALQNQVENTACLTCFDHVGGEVVEDFGIPTHGVGQGGSAFHGCPNSGQRLLESHVFLICGEDLETLN